MALTRTQIDAICTKLQGTRDLSSGGVLALKEVLNGINDELATAVAALATLSTNYDTLLQLITDVSQATVITWSDSAIFNNSRTAVGNGVTLTIDVPTSGDIEFKV